MLRVSCILILLVSLFSCKKDKGLTPVVSFEVSNVICYPYDTTSASVKLTVIGEKRPYTISWDNNSFSGEGPHLSVFKKNITYHVTLTDANNDVKTYSYSIDRSSYDSLTYDYRNDIIGGYTGIINSSSLTNPTTFSWTTTSSNGSYSVAKHSDFNSIIISNTNLPFKSYNKNLKFTGYFAQCSFKSDSMFYNQQSSHGVWYSSFKGKKTN